MIAERNWKTGLYLSVIVTGMAFLMFEPRYAVVVAGMLFSVVIGILYKRIRDDRITGERYLAVMHAKWEREALISLFPLYRGFIDLPKYGDDNKTAVRDEKH